MREAQILSNINQLTRKMIIDYLAKHELSLNAFSKLVKINQPILFKFLNYNTNISSRTIERLGAFLKN
jgi:hypothetical protein